MEKLGTHETLLMSHKQMVGTGGEEINEGIQILTYIFFTLEAQMKTYLSQDPFSTIFFIEYIFSLSGLMP